MFHEIDFCGVFLPPFFPRLLLAGLLYVPLHWFWDRISIQRRVWNRPVFELAVFIILLSAIVYFL
jgi:hypothetical protein